MKKNRVLIFIFSALLLALILPGCSPHRGIYPQLHSLSSQGRYDEGVKLIERSKKLYDKRNNVLFNLDLGVFHHYAGNFQQSNQAFERAERRIDELYTESITGHGVAFLTNDNTLPFRGEDFERVMINLYRALNYVQMGQLDEALVEARKVNQKLHLINDKYDAKNKNVYRDDSFARMLAGILYEAGGSSNDLNDAYISNQKAVNGYQLDYSSHYGSQTPSLLADNLLATAAYMGQQELSRAKKAFPSIKAVSLREKRKLAQVYFVHFAGRSPVKVETKIISYAGRRKIGIAFPSYRNSYYTITGSRMMIDANPSAFLEEVEPIGPIAFKNLDNRKGRILAKAIARAAVKYAGTSALEYQARRRGGALAGAMAGLAGRLFTEATEKADLRAWQTLPDRILVGRALVKPGKHHFQAQLTTKTGEVISSRDLGEVNLKAGSTRFFVYHSSR